ncbi:hypothetical protein J1N35_007664 [Gossypium stocksii]|uniref:WDR11 second beta-propeller domain-containing protein n=1 Tax=Gossypium stocksii TaxID=47602 RepID=A0A9D4AFV7_9ROSI|nr:hypothetical protein J1N35_007664 [Gossypium stocksii]
MGEAGNSDSLQDETSESFAFALVTGAVGVFEVHGQRIRDFSSLEHIEFTFDVLATVDIDFSLSHNFLELLSDNILVMGPQINDSFGA